MLRAMGFGFRNVFSRKTIARLSSAVSLAALVAPVAARSEVGDVLKSFRLYGHFTPAFIAFDDGVGRYNNIADNSYSGGRVGFWLEAPVRKGRTRFNFETSLGLRQSASLNQFNVPPIIDLDATTLRKLEFIFDTEKFGSFSVGQGSMGSDSVTESDLSGTQLAAYVGISDTAGGYFFRTGSGLISSVTISSAFPTFDGGRAPRLRWDSPDLALSWLGTLNVAASAGIEVTDGNLTVNDTLGDVGIFYRNRVGALELKGSGGFSLADVDGTSKPQAAGSFSVLHPDSGLSATGAAGSRQDGGKYYYAKIGVKRRWFSWGETAASVDAYRGTDTFAPGSHVESYGIGIVQDLDRSNLNFYVGFRRYEADNPGVVQYQASNSIIFGTRWTFKRLEAVHFPEGRSEVDWSESE